MTMEQLVSPLRTKRTCEILRLGDKNYQTLQIREFMQANLGIYVNVPKV